MSQKDFKTMVDNLIADEEKRLGIGSREYRERHKRTVERHNEIMGMIEHARKKGAATDDEANYERPGRYGSSAGVGEQGLRNHPADE